MKAIFTKTLKYSTSAFLFYKASSYTYSNYSLANRPTEAFNSYLTEDLIANIVKDEFDPNYKGSEKDRVKYDFKLKSRKEHLDELMKKDNEFDMLIIGAGSSGAGVALEGSSRGLKCAVVDAYDIASGTSSRSTKMAHGGLRYFE